MKAGKAKRTGKPGTASETRRKERHKLDQIMRVLFRLSKRMTVQLINGLFGEQFADHEVKAIYYGNPAFVGEQYELVYADTFLHLDTTRGTYHYHLEVQTLNDRTMIVRMFRYGFEKAAELALNGAISVNGAVAARSLVEDEQLPLLTFPLQIVIFLEENAAIGDELAMRLRLPDGAEAIYRVPVMRYWTWKPEDLQERGLYALLPLQVFRSRKKLQQIAESKISNKERQQRFMEEFAELKTTIERTLAVMNELKIEKQLSLGNMNRMLQALGSILSYLYRNYGEPYEQTQQEVTVMIKSFIDPKIRQEGRQEGRKEGMKEGRKEGVKKGREEGVKEGKLEVARNMLELGFDLAMISQATGLSLKEIERERSNKL